MSSGPPAASLGPIADRVSEALARLERERVVERLWAHDHTLWSEDPTEISDRLGWLTVAEEMTAHVAHLEAFAAAAHADGIRDVVLLGMGGSSLAPEVLGGAYAGATRARLHVLDTTDPGEIAAVESRLEAAHTLFVVASKSGTTIETRSHLDYFWAKQPDGAHFVAITDPGSELETLARERAFRGVFANPPEIGGRYSALSYFGLVPAALLGIELAPVLGTAIEAQRACASKDLRSNPGAWLGAVLGAAAEAGRDKLTLVIADEVAELGGWIEQLVAESTGKGGRGILPVDGEPLGAPEVYGADRLFVAIGDVREAAALEALERAGHPVVRLPFEAVTQLGAEFFRWEFATAVAGHLLGIQPFDQPNVQQAKDATARILAGVEIDAGTPSLDEVLSTVQPGDYIAILAFAARTNETERALREAQRRLRDRYRVATTVGYGPRFLHSTGQLHKGGSNCGVFLAIESREDADVEIPGRPYTFGELKHAQALGDLDSLRALGRRVARVALADLDGVAR